jgi:GH18 family chitinase
MKVFLYEIIFLISYNYFLGYGKRVMCYYTNWSGYRSGDGRFSIQDIDPNLCTHIIYSFASVRGNDLGTTEGNDPGLLLKYKY